MFVINVHSKLYIMWHGKKITFMVIGESICTDLIPAK
jgi:hypothetical protein